MNNNNSSTGMNNYLNEQKKEEDKTVSEALTPPNNASGGQGSSITAGAASSSPNAPKGPTKQAKSGMFTNLNKYIDRNKQGAQQMSGKLQQNVAQQNQSIQQAINKQKTDFMSRVNQNRDRMNAARDFGTGAVNAAGGQVNKDQLGNDLTSVQGRIDSFNSANPYLDHYNYYLGNWQAPTQQPQPVGSGETRPERTNPLLDEYRKDRPRDYVRYTETVSTYDNTQPMSYEEFIKSGTAQSTARDRLRDASRSYQDTQRNLIESLSDNRISKGENQGYYSAKEFQDLGARGYGDAFLDSTRSQIQGEIDKLNWMTSTRPLNEQEQAQLQNLQSDLSQIDAYKQARDSKTEAQGILDQYSAGVNKLTLDPEMQRLADNRRRLQLELNEINDKIANAPEQLTEADIKRFNDLRTGVERFDTAMLNLTQERSQVQDLASQAEALGTSQGRRDLMRRQFGSKGGYTAGQAGLDNLILTGDKQAMRQLVANSQAQAQQAQQALDKAFNEGRITQDEMVRASKKLRDDLQKSVDDAQSALQEGLEGRAATGEGTMLKRLQDKIASGQGLSAEELSILGLEEDAYMTSLPEELLRDIQIDPETFSIQDVATSQDVARAESLARLAGGTPEDYLQNALGLEQSEIDRIKSKGALGEGEKFGTTFEELSAADRKALEGIRGKTQAQQREIEQVKNKIKSLRKRAEEFKAARDYQAAMGGAGNQHWKYHNHYYVTLMQEANKLTRNARNKYFNKDKMAKSEAQTQEQAYQNFMKKFNQG